MGPTREGLRISLPSVGQQIDVTGFPGPRPEQLGARVVRLPMQAELSVSMQPSELRPVKALSTVML